MSQVLAVAAVAAALASGLPALSDEFDGTAPAGWNVLRGDDFGDGTDHAVSVEDGSLRIVPRRSWWVDDHEALYLWKPVAGDFVATMRVRVTGVQTEEPQADWTLSGILVRNPASTHRRENWLAFRTGFAGGGWVYERKTTVGSRSQLVLSTSHGGWVELRVARVGMRFYLLRRTDAGAWKLHWTYVRPDLPKTLQVGIDAFSGDNSPDADMIDRVDWFRFAAPGVTARAANAKIVRTLSQD
jgi:hypothetical protein